MAAVVEWYRDLMDNKSDPRVNDWLLMSGPMPTALICASYAIFVTKIGPKLMENRKPFELKNTLIVYNFLQVLFSMWLFNESIQAGWFTTYSFRCQPVDYSNSPLAIRTTHGCWWYFFSKFTEFFDTFFFILRKKNNQLTRLHVIHHGIMPLSTWFGVKFTPGGHSTFFGMVNTFVHIIMYTYYMLAAMGPSVQKYLWWKKYLTVLQMTQFVLVMLHAFQLLFTDCNYPRAFVWWIGMHAVMFYFLFKDFYQQAYNKRQKLKVEAQQNGQTIVEESSNGLRQRFNDKMKNGKAQNGINGTSYNGSIQNGSATNGIAANGKAHNGSLNNGFANGKAHNGTANGTANGAAHNGAANGKGHNGILNRQNNT